MSEILNKLKNKVIVSVQASKGDPVHDDDCLGSIIKSVIRGGTAGLRLAGAQDINKARTFTDIPIIGITKPEILPNNWRSIVYITPSYKHARQIAESGADIIAIDGTSRERPEENLAELIYKIKNNLNKLVMTDISTLEEGINCASLGADIISTTLSGYTDYTLDKNNGKPDFELLESLVETVNIPVILEGRIWTQEQVKKAIEIGAFAVVIGSAITRPEIITRRFVDFYLST